MPDEFGEHLTRDQRPFLHPESLQILQIPRSMLALLLFSSAHSFSIGFWSGTGMFCAVTHFCFDFNVCFWIIVLLEDLNMACTGCQV